jgi:hypothetical protein
VDDVSNLAVARITPVERPTIATPPAQDLPPTQQQANRSGRDSSSQRDERPSQSRSERQRVIDETCERLREKHYVTREEYAFYRQYCRD